MYALNLSGVEPLVLHNGGYYAFKNDSFNVFQTTMACFALIVTLKYKTLCHSNFSNFVLYKFGFSTTIVASTVPLP